MQRNIESWINRKFSTIFRAPCQQHVANRALKLGQAIVRVSNMRSQTQTFDPTALKQLCGAFDAAWSRMKDTTSDADRDSVRDAIGKSIIGLARHRYTNTDKLAALAAYRGQMFIDLRY